MAKAVTKVLQNWRNRLIDLTFRNPLLELKTRSLVEISAPDGVELWNALSDGRSYRFPRWERRRTESTSEGFTADDAETAFGAMMVPGDLSVLPETASVERLLKRLQEADQALVEEQGVASLYLALGVLHWREAQGSAEHRSPLLLLPVNLERSTPLEPFRLVARDDDPAINPALRERLRSDYQFDLPTQDEEDIDPAKYLRTVATAVRRHGWRVEQRSYVGRFHFAKLVMYREMTERLDAYAAHPLLQALATGSPVRDAVADANVEADALDTLPPDDVHEVLDADSTQLIAIRKALGGSHLVIEGPPGTGKSQTIANIIASLLGQGKNVLFVSEKAAALEVVADRLKKAGLGEFILPIYGKPDRGAIVRDLDRAISTQPALPAVDERLPLEYKQTRDKLRRYVTALHTPVEGTGLTPHAVYARLAALADAPRIDFPVPDPLSWNEDKRRQVEELLDGLATYSGVVEAGRRHPWYGYAGPDTGLLSVREERVDELQDLLNRVTALRTAAESLARRLGLAAPTTAQDVAGLATLLKFCENAPVTGGQWFEPSTIDELSVRAQEWAARTHTYRELQARLDPIYPPENRLSASRLTALKDALAKLDAVAALHPEVETNLSSAFTQFLHAERLLESLDVLQAVQSFLVEDLGLPWPTLPTDIPRLEHLIGLLLETPAAEPAWLSDQGLRNAQEQVRQAEPHFAALLRGRDRLDMLAPKWRETTPDALSTRLQPFQSVFQRVLHRGQLTALLKQLSTELGADQTFERLQEVLRLMTAVASETTWTAAADIRLREALGRHYNGEATDWARAAQACDRVSAFLDSFGGGPIPDRLQVLLTVPVFDMETRSMLTRAFEACRGLASAVAALKPLPGIPFQGSLDDMAAQARAYLGVARPIQGVVEILKTRSTPEVSRAQLGVEIEWLRESRAHERAMDRAANDLRAAFGPYFDGYQTDWSKVISALQWCGEVSRLPGPDLSEEFKVLLTKGLPAETAQLAEAMAKAEAQLADRLQAFVSAFPDAPETPIATVIRSEPFKVAEAYLQDRLAHLTELDDWVAVRGFYRQLADLGFAEFAHAVQQSEGLTGRQAINAFWRTFYRAWLDQVARSRHVLAGFRERRHMESILRFRNLDRELQQWHRIRLRHQLLQRRPRELVVAASAEPAIIRREAQKKRRHMPLRRLFAQVPHLIADVKPCLLMSPLWVSTLLNPDVYRFDAVIFDEASQIRPEDAAGAILRARQAIVVGDPHQLPPTDFFTDRDVASDDDNEDELDSLVFDSLLDLCLGSQVARTRLRWHYRSRHESLIAFSNHEVYQGDLVTFPSAVERAPYRGVEYVYVPDGVYGRGGTRANLPEARRVVDLIVDHVREYPHLTLGVVTFSTAQMEAIQDELELRTKAFPDLAPFVGESSPIQLFVKNLERVQGDERDVMFISTGYGRDINGRLHFQFGPLARDDGYRRLNVAVTRARDHVKVVTSLSAQDLAARDVGGRGVKMLQRYLDYAEHGPAALGMGRGPGEELAFESSFEESVYHALTALGWAVRTQVGVGPYRIDLGVIHPEQPTRFLLGIECDGAAYHGTPTARERDRLRQEVLEGLGWRIVRIWSPDWIRNRPEVLERLQQEYAAALKEDTFPAPPSRPPEEPLEAPSTEPPEEMSPPVEQPSPWLKPYREADLSRVHSLSEAIQAMVAEEGPVHLRVVVRRLFGKASAKREAELLAMARHTLRLTLEVRQHGEDWYLYRRDGVLEARELGDRSLQEVAPEELVLVLAHVLQNAYSMTLNDLVRTTAGIYGIRKAGSRVSMALKSALAWGVKKGMFEAHEGRVTLRRSEDPQAQRS